MHCKLAGGFMALAMAAWAQTPCDQIKTLSFPDTVIASAEIVPAGAYTTPGAQGGQEQPAIYVPARCRVEATLKPSSDSEIAVEVWMPVADWNGKFQAVGNGGWAGIISYGAMALAVKEGYATASTDTGHRGVGSDASFALGHPERVIDFSYRAVHEMTVKAKAMITTFYGRGPRLSYWNGCSTGGRQGLMEAQKYPEDFDGIIAGAPANYMTHLLASMMADGAAALKDPASHIGPADLALVHSAVLAACDANDGVKDGLIADPRRCHFDPSVLLCRTSASSNCLSAAQVEVIKKVYAPLKTKDGVLIYPGLEPGSEASWIGMIGGPQPFDVAHSLFANVVYKNPKWDWHTFDADRDTALADSNDTINAISPDLAKFQARGGKLLMYHGWADQLISPGNSLNYYASVVEHMGPNQGNWYRLFMAPGMLHCTGGPGPDQFNALGALERWREANIAPDQIVAAHVAANRVDMTRPLCPYPQTAQWNGTGNTDDAANFACKAP